VKAVNKKIVVRVNMAQKSDLEIGGVKFKMAPNFDPNYRERSPVVGEIITGNKWVSTGQIAVFHHNNFYPPSPYFYKDDLFSVPFNRTVLAVFTETGDLSPICGNILCSRVEIETSIPLPPEKRKYYNDRVVCVDPGWLTDLRKGQLLFCTPLAMYEIVYNVNGVEKRINKVHSEFIIGVA